MKATIQWLVSAAAVLLSVESQAMGIHSDELKLSCSGELTISAVHETDVIDGFIDRAGNYHPPKGMASLLVDFTHFEDSCAELESKLLIDLDAHQFSKSVFFETTDLDEIQKLAEQNVGKILAFETKQNFHFQQDNGFLPLFPLIHGETVSLLVEDNYIHNTYSVDEKQAYKLHLSEDEKVLLSETIFAMFEQGTPEGIDKSSLIKPLLQNHPAWSENFKPFLDKVFKYFQLAEQGEFEPETPGSVYFDWTVQNFVSEIVKLTKEYPEYYSFDMPQLLASFPSVLSSKGFINQCPNITASDFDEAMLILEQSLAQETLHPVVKEKFGKVIQYAAGHFSGGGSCITTHTSLFAKEKAKELYQLYYQD